MYITLLNNSNDAIMSKFIIKKNIYPVSHSLKTTKLIILLIFLNEAYSMYKCK